MSHFSHIVNYILDGLKIYWKQISFQFINLNIIICHSNTFHYKSNMFVGPFIYWSDQCLYRGDISFSAIITVPPTVVKMSCCCLSHSLNDRKVMSYILTRLMKTNVIGWCLSDQQKTLQNRIWWHTNMALIFTSLLQRT